MTFRTCNVLLVFLAAAFAVRPTVLPATAPTVRFPEAHHAVTTAPVTTDATATAEPADEKTPGEKTPGEKIIVTVNGKPITERDVQTMMVTRQVPPALRKSVRKVIIQRLIDYRLVREFLEERNIEPKPAQLDAAVRRVHGQIRAQGGDPETVLKQHGLNDDALRRELWLPVAWHTYARQIITDRAIRERFRKRRRQFDGTRVRASQILLKLSRDATEADKRQAVGRLEGIRRDILAGRIAFADAAKQHSQAPSGKQGGDVGVFGYSGDMPQAVARVAFSLKKGEISQPFVTRFGVHLLQVTDVTPGQLSLEDARPKVFRQIAQQRWDDLVTRLRKTATITWTSKP